MTTATTFSSPPASPLNSRHLSPKRSMPLKVADVANILVKIRRTQSKTVVQCDSGELPLTHPTFQAGALSPKQVPLAQEEGFVCKDGVDVVKLLRAVRGSLYERAQLLGANVLVQEQ